MNIQDFQEMYESSTFTGYDEIVRQGAKRIADPKTGRAWMTYVEAREGSGYMGEKQNHEEAAKQVSKYHDGF